MRSFLVRVFKPRVQEMNVYLISIFNSNAYFFCRKEIGERNCKERNLWVSLLDLTSTPRFLRDRGENGSRVKKKFSFII